MAVFLGQFLTSFVELIPGERNAVYAVASIAALTIAFLLIAQRVVSLRQPISQR